VKISEIFHSIQGEGVLVGLPSVFVRTSGCNLRCAWCDTPYTSWKPEGEDLSVDEVVHAAAEFGTRHIVVTGGEPMIVPEIVTLTRELKQLGKHITIETAGTVYAPVVCDLMSISPKLSNSVPHEREGGKWAAQHERLRYQPEILGQLMRDFEHQLKFVVTSPDDLHEIEEMRHALSAKCDSIVLMPEGTDRDVLRDRALWLVEICKNRGYRFSPRLHIELWGNRRGV